MYNQELLRIDQFIENGPFKDTWESLAEYQVPKWYTYAKFGIFSHFGPYTVPEFGHDWYVHGMYTDGDFINEYHKQTYGPLDKFGYKHLVKLFKAEAFNAKEWLDLIEKSGARYYVPVAEHHDGFQMYESKYSEWNSRSMGPQIDFIEELKLEAEKHSIEFGLSTHRAEHWFFLSPGLDINSDVHSSKFGDLYWPTQEKYSIGQDEKLTKQYLDDWLVRTVELIDVHKPRVLYFDFWIEHPIFKNHVKKVLAYYYNRMLSIYGDCGVINYKHDGVPYGCAVRDMERGQFTCIQRDYWQACTSSTHGAWIYTKTNQFKQPIDLIRTLVDVVSKNGNLLLNIGPRADGSICSQEVAILNSIGKWLETNGEAIYDTIPWKIFGEGQANVAGGDFSEGQEVNYTSSDIRFTCRANRTYAILMNPAGKCKFTIKNFGTEKKEFKKNNEIISVTALGENKIVSWQRDEKHMSIEFENQLEALPVVIKVEVK